MKKTILTILCASLLTAVNANTTKKAILTNTLEYSINLEVNSFCKLIQMGELQAVEALIENGQNLNEVSSGLTPLMFAARHNRVSILKALIKNGAKLKVKSRKGETALDWAKKSNAKEAYKILESAIKNEKKLKALKKIERRKNRKNKNS
tara:strand:- start:5021 stop:5470 length:450 start_codon:yes stop_codon:yes gene_type:complete